MLKRVCHRKGVSGWHLSAIRGFQEVKFAPIIKKGGQQTAILVCVSPRSRDATEGRIAELRELARTAGVQLSQVVHQRRARPDPVSVLRQRAISAQIASL